uniref:Putative secreted peptide n=1 Tax=Anopheles braziliensis TaxID=58242 RepID=A0A2M3ZTZ2_9DIPT
MPPPVPPAPPVPPPPTMLLLLLLVVPVGGFCFSGCAAACGGKLLLAGVTLLSAIISPTATTEAPERLPGARVTHTHHDYTRTHSFLPSD